MRFFPYKSGDSGRHLIHAAMHFLLFITLLIFSYAMFVCSSQAASIAGTTESARWSYVTGTARPSAFWTHIGFDNSGWQNGQPGFGYGNAAVTTPLDNMRGRDRKVFVRRNFSIVNPLNVDRIILSVVCDGPFAAYINGIEVIRNSVGYSAPGQSGANAPAEPLDLSGIAHELLPGTNVMSIECENDNINSEDFLFIPLFEVHEQ